MLRAITNSNIGSTSQINVGDDQSNIGQNLILGGGISAALQIKSSCCNAGRMRVNVIGTGMLAASYINLEVTCADLQTGKKGLDLEVADQLVALIGRLAGTAQQSGFTAGRFGLEQPVSMPEPAMATAVRAVYFIKSRRENV